jgi:fumarylacetoacetase
VNQPWLETANEGFGLHHLPYGAFQHHGEARLCIRLGPNLLDLAACVDDGLLAPLPEDLRQACRQPLLNPLLYLGPAAWQQLREHLQDLLSENQPKTLQARVDVNFRPIATAQLVLPLHIPAYTDFYASLHHARRVGELFRPDEPLLPNYRHVPIAYNGRASSIVPSGTPIRRPWGQQRPPAPGAPPTFAPTRALDYEAELAFIIGPGNPLGQPIPIADAPSHIFGVALLNDWSARDIQAWEYQPLGPFLGKSFATSLSPWITPMAALAPFRRPPLPREPADPQTLPYLTSPPYGIDDQQHGALDLTIEAHLTTPASRAASLPPFRLTHANTLDLYWTSAQMLAHHTSNGCNLQPGDILATGTISGPNRRTAGCLLELALSGRDPVQLPNGEQRVSLLDGDELTLTASCTREGHPPLRLGECRGRITSPLSTLIV